MSIDDRVKAARRAMRPDSRPDRPGDVWVRPESYEGEPLRERSLTVDVVGEDSLSMDDGAWWGDFELMDGGWIRQVIER